MQTKNGICNTVTMVHTIVTCSLQATMVCSLTMTLHMFGLDIYLGTNY